MKEPWNVNLAYARLGKLDEARASIAKVLKDKPGWTPDLQSSLQSEFVTLCPG
jgi:hypothetical protein